MHYSSGDGDIVLIRLHFTLTLYMRRNIRDKTFQYFAENLLRRDMLILILSLSFHIFFSHHVDHFFYAYSKYCNSKTALKTY